VPMTIRERPSCREWILGALDSSGNHKLRRTTMEQLSSVTRYRSEASIEVVSVEVLDGESDRVRLQCQHPNTCLPSMCCCIGDGPDDEQSTLSGPQKWQSTGWKS